MKIFRNSFLTHNIQVLKGTEDNFIKKGYFGGATDYYKLHAKNIKYYDINSLYPYAMLKPMPHHIIAKHTDLSNFKLEDFFGFCLAEVTCPKNMLRPLLPYKSEEDRTIYPVGTWTGIYFSEELKAVKEQGYTIKLISGYEFSKAYIFKDYVQHFYNKKKESTGAERFIAKMHLNQLYGIFGRKLETIETINVNAQQLKVHLLSSNIKSIIEIGDDLYAVMLYSNSGNDMLMELNSEVEIVLPNKFNPEVKSNVQ